MYGSVSPASSAINAFKDGYKAMRSSFVSRKCGRDSCAFLSAD